MQKEPKESKLRIAIINPDKCKPKKCHLECKKICPINKGGKLCVEVTTADKICAIAENLCIGCGLCVKKCPFDAIKIINLPKDIDSQTTHRFSQNSFKLHRLPYPQLSQVLGLVGTNGIGKTTALLILSGELKPNFGKYDNPPDWNQILKRFKGTELYNYFKKYLDNDLVITYKIQHVDAIKKNAKGTLRELFKRKDKEEKRTPTYVKALALENLIDRDINTLSGGELQRFAICYAAVQQSDVYMFDEPTSYLDVRQRLNAADAIRSLSTPDNYIICVEHDLSVLDYLSDSICVLYGVPAAYGVVTIPYGVREGINVFLDGFIPTENMRFRDFGLSFKIADNTDIVLSEKDHNYKYPAMTKQLGTFTLHVEEGAFSNCEIIVLLGENGTGKTTLVRMLSGDKKCAPDDTSFDIPELSISYKPQTIAPKFPGTVSELLHGKLKEVITHQAFLSEVVRPLSVQTLFDNEVQKLSGGELQRVAIVLALGKKANVYLIDEPSAYLDSEQRIIASKVMKRFVLNANKTAFVVEHDFIMATYMADRVIVYEGTPAVETTATTPRPMIEGMNNFLKMMNITFRRDNETFRPRINKMNSVKDREQKEKGLYFYYENL
ncbi:MAG: ribosome biogenesis/translation initiation ATPase RLI [archaeon]|nr:ribosome biogenesis/translation initiation ATPase RLI [archaeon]